MDELVTQCGVAREAEIGKVFDLIECDLSRAGPGLLRRADRDIVVRMGGEQTGNDFPIQDSGE